MIKKMKMKIWKGSWKWKVHHIDTTGLDTDKIIINIESVSGDAYMY